MHLFLALLVLSSIVAGCGGSQGSGTTSPGASRTVTLGESGQGGAGDEHPIATQVVYDVHGTTASPAVVSAPAFIRIALTCRSDDDRQHVVRVALPRRVKMTVPPGGGATVLLGGQKKGTYAITVDGGPPSARLVVK